MINLEKISGLPIAMRDDFSLVFGGDLPLGQPFIREFSAVKNYLKNPRGSLGRKDVYHIYRDLAKPEDKEAMQAFGLQYDLTVIPPGKIGDEFVKTIGHYHSYKSGTSVRYPEVYEVIFGRVFLLLQSASEDLKRLGAVYLVEGKKGEKILVPPGFGHVSINPTGEVLVLANLQARGNQAIYEPYEARSGAVYYVIEAQQLNKSGQTTRECEVMPNLNYDFVPELKRVVPRELPQYDLLSAVPMYFSGIRNLKTLDFLLNPENHLDELLPEKLFK